VVAHRGFQVDKPSQDSESVTLVKQKCWECDLDLLGPKLANVYMVLCDGCVEMYQIMEPWQIERKKLEFRVLTSMRN
jgi:hypothetical protein